MPLSVYASGINGAYGIVMNKNNNYLYVANLGDNTITEIDTAGHSSVFVSMNQPANVIFDSNGFPSGYMYAVDVVGIYKINVMGTKTLFHPTPDPESGSIFGMVMDSVGNLYYSVSNTGTVFKIDPMGTKTTFITGLENFTLGMTMDPSTGIFYICNVYNVSTYDQDGTLINPTFLTSTDSQVWLNLLWDDTTNSLYTTSTDAFTTSSNTVSNVQQYGADGSLLTTIYTNPPSETLITFSLGITLDNQHNLYFVTQNLSVIIQYMSSTTCFKEGTKILTNNGYVPIEELHVGDLIKTLRNDNQPIVRIGVTEIYHSYDQIENRDKNRLYRCSPVNYPDTGLIEDLILTGCHSILVDDFVSQEQREQTIQVNGKIYVTDHKYRLPACVDPRSTIYEIAGHYRIYHLALQHEDIRMNYGIYANGLLVETCSIRFMEQFANMTPR